MRNLDSINGAAKSTKFIFSISLVIPIFMGFAAWALATGAAPSLALHDNYLALLGLGISSLAILALPVPYIFRWNWETKYFGASVLSLSSAAIIGIYPTLCVAFYGSPPIFLRFLLVLFEFILIFGWCRRFADIYKNIYLKKTLFCCIYIEEPCGIYYSQQGDKKVIESLLNFKQFPSSIYFIISSLIAFSLFPFATTISRLAGVPFIHIFLTIFATPLNLLFLGLATRGWLVFYFYPMKIKREKNKPIYVDISSRPPKITI